MQSSVCEKIMELLGQNKIDHHQRQVAILSQDSFYKVLTPEQKAKALKGQFNFDHPGSKALNCLTQWPFFKANYGFCAGVIRAGNVPLPPPQTPLTTS